MNLFKVIALNSLLMYPFLELTRLIVWHGETYAVFSESVIELAAFWLCWFLFNIFLTKTEISSMPKRRDLEPL